MSDNNRPDFRSGIDWAKLRAAAAQHQFSQMLGQRFTWRKAASILAGLVLVFVVSLWLWIYWGLPRVPDADALWALNRQPSVMFVDRDGDFLGVRGPYYGQRARLSEVPDYVPQAFLAIEDRVWSLIEADVRREIERDATVPGDGGPARIETSPAIDG